MSILTYSDFQELSASEKIGLVALDAGLRLMGWTLYSGSVYRIAFSHPVVVSIKDSGSTYISVSSIGDVTAGKYYHDRTNGYLYLRASDSSNPNSRYLACTIRLFFANIATTLPHDLSTGYEVVWEPYLKDTSDFGVQLDNNNLLGFALEGSGKVSFFNDRDYWGPIYDKYYFENQKCFVYSWHRELPVTEARLLYRGTVQGKTYTKEAVSFSLKDNLNALRAPIPLSTLGEYVGASIPPSLQNAKQRLLYGYVTGMRPTNIDQPLKLTGYTLTGTATVTDTSATVTGSGTSFLLELSPDDELLFGSDTEAYTIKSVDSNTQITLTEPYDGSTASGRAIRLKDTSRAKRYYNREFLVAGHALREPTTTVTAVYSGSSFDVASARDFIAGEQCVINGENVTINRVSGNRITLNQSLASVAIGDTIKVISIRNVYINNRLLTHLRDYTYSALSATITLDTLAEFNVASVRTLAGTVTFTNGSRTVTGTTTFFKRDLKSGDWIKRSTESDWFEVLSVDSDTSLTLRSASTYSGTGVGNYKTPEIYLEGSSVLSCDCLGATDDGTVSGTFLSTAPRVVKDILERVGLEDVINTASFTAAEAESSQFLGFVIPEKYSETKVTNARTVINLVNQSVFGSLYQNEDFELCYSVLSPEKPESMLTLTEAELLSIGIESDNSNIAKTVTLQYQKKEYDPESGAGTVSTVQATSETAQYLAQSSKEVTVETVLYREADAEAFAYRRAFLLEAATSVVKMRVPLIGADAQINDKVRVSHPYLYERVGSSAKKKIGGVSSAKKDLFGCTIEIDDISNAFGRCATIAANTTSDYSDASDEELAVSGFITDEYGMIDNDASTFGINVIW